MPSYDLVTGGGGDSNTLDVELSNQKYEQQTGNRVDFTVDVLSTVVNEQFSLNESRTLLSEIVRDEGLSVSEARSLSLEKNVAADLVLDDVRSSSIAKPLNAGVGLNDLQSEEASFFRNYNEAFSVDDFIPEIFTIVNASETFLLNDADVRQVEKDLNEALFGDESYNRTGSFERGYDEAFSLNEVFDGVKIRFLTVSEAFSLDESTELLTILRNDAGIGLNDAYSREASFERNYSETAALSGSDSFFLQRALGEDLVLDTFAPVTTVARLDESFSLNDTEIMSLGKSLIQGFGVDDSIREKRLFAVRNEDLVLNDADIRQVEKPLTEVFATEGVYSREADLFRSQTEDFVLDDSLVKKPVKAVEETFSLDDTDTRRLFKALKEELVLDGFYSSEADFFKDLTAGFVLDDVRSEEFVLFRNYEAGLGLGDSNAKEMRKQLVQGFELFDEFDFFFSEGPGVPPYYVRNSYIQGNSLQNSYLTKTVENVFESFDVSNLFGENEQL